MQIKISKTLEAIIARAAFNTTKAGLDHSLKDFLTLELLREEGSLAYQLLSSRLKDWELYQIRLRIEREMLAGQQNVPQSPEEFYRAFTEELRACSGAARSVSTAHALRAIVGDRTTATSRVLEMYGITGTVVDEDLKKFAVGDDFRTEIQVHMLDFNEENKPEEKTSSHLLDKFGVNLTRMAREGKIDPVVGREQEIERVVQILSRRKKNNPILIGEAGVGKSAIVEGLALRIASGEVPYTIADKTLFSLDVSSLVAGTKFRGEFEERMQQLLDELRKAKDTIIFIDEIHTIVGAGSTQGSLDTANILKPALARGELQTIGATTLDEYRENIESDSALERRFQKVVVEPTTPDQTLQILRNIAPHYERHHKVRYTEEALQACVTLTGRYITDRFFPDKAIDVMDEAGSRIHLQSAREPAELREMETALTDAQRERREAVEALVYEKAASARMREIALRSKLGETRAEWKRSLETNPVEVTAEHIQQVITSITGIPAERISGGEMTRLQMLYDHLARRVVGQQEAVERIARTIRRSRAGLKDENRPIGVFLFVGPTGVGKTLLAKEVSKWLFDEHRGLIRIDMSEYGEKHNVARLIGSPPGYVGYGEGGQLTEAVRRQPYSVVLFDEIEKAHPDIFNILLQVLEEGRLTDSQGKTVDFRNTVIIMTSNVGAREIAQDASVGFGTTGEQGLTSSEIRGRAMGELKRLFRPELLNRIDDIVVFQKLSGENLTKIAHLLVDDLRQRLIANGMNIKLTDAAYDKIVAEGTDLTNGARPLRRAIQKLIEDPLSEELLAGEWGEGDTVLCDVADGKFVFSHGTGEIPAPRPAGTLGGDTAPAAPHTGNAAPVSGGVTSGPGGMMQAGSGAL